jgi:hypothetical protein
VERSSRLTLLVHLPRLEEWGEKPPVKNGPSLGDYGAVAMNVALMVSMTKLPQQLRKTLTWDRGKELSGHALLLLKPEPGCSSLVHTRRGSAPRMRTPMACCGSISPRALICRDGQQKILKRLLMRSTTGPAKSSDGRHQLKSSKNRYARFNNPVLQRLVEPAQYTSIVLTEHLALEKIAPSIGSVGDCP